MQRSWCSRRNCLGAVGSRARALAAESDLRDELGENAVMRIVRDSRESGREVLVELGPSTELLARSTRVPSSGCTTTDTVSRRRAVAGRYVTVVEAQKRDAIAQTFGPDQLSPEGGCGAR